MKKLKIYLDTSTISHLDAQDTPEKMSDTLRLWNRIKDDESLASKFIDFGILRQKSFSIYLHAFDNVQTRAMEAMDNYFMSCPKTLSINSSYYKC